MSNVEPNIADIRDLMRKNQAAADNASSGSELKTEVPTTQDNKDLVVPETAVAGIPEAGAPNVNKAREALALAQDEKNIAMAQQGLPVASGIVPTSTFSDEKTTSENKPASSASKSKRNVDPAMDALLADVVDTIVAKQKLISESSKALRAAYSKFARSCGNITLNPDKFDFYVSKTKPATATKEGENVLAVTKTIANVGVKNSPPSAIISVLVKEPIKISEAIRNNIDDTPLDTIAALVAEENKSYRIRAIDFKSLPVFLQTETAGYLYEDEAIFEPYSTKTLSVISYNDCPTASAAKNAIYPCLYSDLNSRSQMKAFGDGQSELSYKVKHSYRSRIVTPHSYISLRAFDTIPVGGLYSEKDAAELNALYFTKYSVANKTTGISVLDCLDSANRTIIMEAKTGGSIPKISGSTFFPTAGQNWFDTHSITSWYNKVDGAFAPVAKSDVKLIKKENSAKKENETKAHIVYKEIKPESSDSKNYRYEPNGIHAAIFKASGNLLSFEDIIAVRAHTTRSSTSTGKNKRVKTSISSEMTAGLSQEYLIELFKKKSTA